MKTITTLLLAIILPLSSALAEEKKGQEPALELFKLLKLEQVMKDRAAEGFAPFLKKLKGRGYSDEVIKEVSEAANVYFDQAASDPDLRAEMVALYAKAYTAEELEELIIFYKSPLGRKTLESMPALRNQGSQLGRKYAEKYSANFKEQLTRIMKNKQPGDAGE